LAFLYRHPVTLASLEQIALLVGHEVAAVDSALKKLQHEKLMARSQMSLGVCLFRFLTPTEIERKGYLRQLTKLLESRAGRVLVANQLKLDGKELQREERSHRSDE
jgi:hypothetical protein